MSQQSIIRFNAQIDAFAEKLKILPSIVQKKVTIDLWSSITRRTPVDTGRARANWFVSEGAPTDQVDLHEGAAPGSVPEPELPDVSQLTGLNSVFIVNNLPYIQALEDGHSKQAPNGMVRLAVQAAELRIDKALKEAADEAGL